MTSWASLPLRIKIYISAIVLLATPVAVSAITNVLSGNYGYRGQMGYEWLILTAITLITVPIFIFLPSVSTAVSIGDTYVISIAMLYGRSPAIVANALYITFQGLLLRQRHRVPFFRLIFNIASNVINVWLYSFVYDSLNPSRSHSLEQVILPTFGLALSFFLSNSFLVAFAVALSTGRNVFSFWYQNYRFLILDFLVSACAGAFIILFKGFNMMAPLLVAPFVGAVWGINKINKAKAMEAEEHLKEQEELYLRTVESLGLAVDAKDQTTYGHIRRVRAYAMGLARLCGIKDKNELMAIETGSLLHDIGKLAIDDYILNKPGRLSKQEFEKMKMHAAAGDEILQQIKFPFPVAKYVRYHHERWDGSGYPDGLKRDEIPLGARIISIADAFDAIRSARPYKLSFNIQDSIDLLRAQSGTMYDPQLVELFIKNLDELESSASEASKDIPQLSFRNYFEKVDRALSSANSPAAPPSLTSASSSELIALYEFCNSLGRHLDLSDSLPILARRLRRLLPFTTIAFFLDDQEGGLKAEFVSGKFSDVLQNLRLEYGKGISGWVAAYQRPIFNTGPALEFQDIKGDYTSLTDALIVPLVLEGTPLGTISLYGQAPIFYSETHLGLLQMAAGQIAPLIAEARNRATASTGQDLIDPLTQTHRSAFLPVAGLQMIAAAAKSQSPLSLLYVDLKDYSHLSNLYGIQTGHSILRKAAEILKSELRETDVVVRYGHQGFVALLAGVGADRVRRLALRVQQQIRTTPVDNIAGHNIFVAAQTAFASFPEDGSTVHALLDSAHRSIAEQGRPAQRSGEDAEGNILEFPPRM